MAANTKPLIVIDGSNVAMNYGRGATFACRGLRLAVNFFKGRGHEVTVYVPEWRVQAPRKAKPIKDRQILEELRDEGVLVFTPHRCYDDRYILDCASKYRGIVVSNDRYLDLYKDNEDWKNVISNRLLQFGFVGDKFTPREYPPGWNAPTPGPTVSGGLKNSASQPKRSPDQQIDRPAVVSPFIPASGDGTIHYVVPRLKRLLDRSVARNLN